MLVITKRHSPKDGEATGNVSEIKRRQSGIPRWQAISSQWQKHPIPPGYLYVPVLLRFFGLSTGAPGIVAEGASAFVLSSSSSVASAMVALDKSAASWCALLTSGGIVRKFATKMNREMA